MRATAVHPLTLRTIQCSAQSKCFACALPDSSTTEALAARHQPVQVLHLSTCTSASVYQPVQRMWPRHEAGQLLAQRIASAKHACTDPSLTLSAQAALHMPCRSAPAGSAGQHQLLQQAAGLGQVQVLPSLARGQHVCCHLHRRGWISSTVWAACGRLGHAHCRLHHSWPRSQQHTWSGERCRASICSSSAAASCQRAPSWQATSRALKTGSVSWRWPSLCTTCRAACHLPVTLQHSCTGQQQARGTQLALQRHHA